MYTRGALLHFMYTRGALLHFMYTRGAPVHFMYTRGALLHFMYTRGSPVHFMYTRGAPVHMSAGGRALTQNQNNDLNEALKHFAYYPNLMFSSPLKQKETVYQARPWYNIQEAMVNSDKKCFPYSLNIYFKLCL